MTSHKSRVHARLRTHGHMLSHRRQRLLALRRRGFRAVGLPALIRDPDNSPASTSTTSAVAGGPTAEHAAAASANRSSCRPHRLTCRPRRARSVAMARAIVLDAPTTKACPRPRGRTPLHHPAPHRRHKHTAQRYQLDASFSVAWAPLAGGSQRSASSGWARIRRAPRRPAGGRPAEGSATDACRVARELIRTSQIQPRLTDVLRWNVGYT